MAIVFDSLGTGANGVAGSVMSWTHTVVANTNGIIIAFPTGNGTANVTSLKYAGQVMTKIIAGTHAASLVDYEAWYLINPPTGLGTFNGTFAANNNERELVSLAYTGVDQTTPILGSVRSVGTTQTSGSVTRTITAGNIFIGGALWTNLSGTLAIGTQRGTSGINGKNQVGDSAGTVQWTNVASDFAAVGIEVGAAAVATGVIAPLRNLMGVGQ